MKLKFAAGGLAVTGVLALLATPAIAQSSQTKRGTVAYNRDRTVVVTRDEDGRTRTRIIIQKRSFLDPGTETFAGERSDHEYAMLPGQHATTILDNTIFGTNMSPLPGPFTLPGRNNPWIGY